jgi:hypothetical protein
MNTAMTDVSQALQVPTVFPESNLGGLLSALLVWDRVLIPRDQLAKRSERLDGVLERLEDEGACQRVDLAGVAGAGEVFEEAAKRAVGEYELKAGSVDGGRTAAELGARVTVDLIAALTADAIGAAVESCAQLHAAPLALGPLSHISASLPPRDDEVPAREGRLISTAVQGLAVGPETPVDDLLKFRDDHAPLRGRFRAAMVDLAGTLAKDLPLGKSLAEADAVVSNRVTPAISDLDHALSQGRISYFWQALLVGSAVASGPVTPGIATSGAATFVTHSLAYAFNRRRLVAEHPYGLLHQARRRFPVQDIAGAMPVTRVITDPQAEIRRLWQVAMEPAVSAIGELAAEAGQERRRLAEATSPGIVQLLSEGIERARQEG